jgi:uncharacterized integral membrane protein
MSQTFGRLNNNNAASVLDWLIRILAVWLFFSPWILQFGKNTPTGQTAAGSVVNQAVSNASWNAWILGALIFIISLSALGRNFKQEWINLVLGAWIFIAPWALGFASGNYATAAWDHWIVGALIFIAAAVIIFENRSLQRPARVP